MRAVCIARHQYLTEHLCSIFDEIGIECTGAVGFQAGVEAAQAQAPNVVICDYDLLTAAPLVDWESDPTLAPIPIIPVSLTRRPDEAPVIGPCGVAGFLYLATLDKEEIKRAVNTAAAHRVRPPARALQWRSEADATSSHRPD
jgi:DNA-binding NarL/FixJ family response regulator